MAETSELFITPVAVSFWMWQGRAKSNSMLDLFLSPLLFIVSVIVITERRLSIAVSEYNGQSWGTCRSVWMLKFLCSDHRETFWPCPPVNSFRKEEFTTPPPQTSPSQEVLCKTNCLFILLPHLLPLSVL